MAQKTVFHTDIYIEKELEQETSGDIQILAKRTTDNKTVWVEAGGGGGIESVSGDSVDNTDPLNPVINAIPLTGTTAGNPVTGDVEFDDGVTLKPVTTGAFNIGHPLNGRLSFVDDGGVEFSAPDNPESRGIIGIQDYTSNITALDYVQKKYVDDHTTLQAVTDDGNETTNNIVVKDGNEKVTITPVGVEIFDEYLSSVSRINTDQYGILQLSGAQGITIQPQNGGIGLYQPSGGGQITIDTVNGIQLSGASVNRIEISNVDGGMKYVSPISGTVTDRTIPDKAYVQSMIDLIPSGATNLSYTASPTNGTVNSDTGTDATIPLADNTNAGLMPANFYVVYPETAYTETVTWGGTAPTTMQNSTWQATKIGNRLSLRMNINYATAGAGNTTAQVPLPTGVPLPSSITGFTSNNSYMAVGSAAVSTGITSNPTISRAVLRRETGTTYSVYNSFSSGAYNTIIIDIEYFTD